MCDFSFILAQTVLNVTSIQLLYSSLGIIVTLTLAFWRIDRARKKDIDDKIQKKVDITVFESKMQANSKDHARYDQELNRLEDDFKGLQKTMAEKIDKIYEILINKG